MKTVIKYTILISFFIVGLSSCTPPEDHIEQNPTTEVLATGDDSSVRPDNEKD